MTFSANGQVVTQRVKQGSNAPLYYSLHTDHLGNVAAVADSAGAYVPNSYAVYEPFGAFLTTPTGTNPSVTDRGFTGHRHNNTGSYNFGLIYMNARYYLPQLGRFVSPDTIVPELSNPQSYNRYSYIENRVLNGTDPTGHCIIGYSGDVRMNEGPYGTSGICPNTESVITEGHAAMDAYHADPSTKSTTGEMVFWYFGAPLIIIGGATVGAEAIAAIPALAAPAAALGGDGDPTNEGSQIVRYAQSLQGSGNYPGIDKFTEVILRKGDLLVGAAEGQGRTPFYTSVESFLRLGRNAETLWRGLQVFESDEFGYRTGVTLYKLTQDVVAAAGKALANPANGPGGYDQFVIQDFRNVLEPLMSFLLNH